MENTDNSSPVQDFFRGKNIFITGGTGFLGMALIEKLLRSCPDVGTIYVLVRPKKGKEVSARLEELIKNSVSTELDILTSHIISSLSPQLTRNS
jgi:fatty acyl-CoA reductase